MTQLKTVHDGATSKIWKSSRDLTNYEKCQQKKEKKRKKKRKLALSQGLLDLINLGNDRDNNSNDTPAAAATSEDIDNISKHSRPLSDINENNKQVRNCKRKSTHFESQKEQNIFCF